jgi:hypothetical protein
MGLVLSLPMKKNETNKGKRRGRGKLNWSRTQNYAKTKDSEKNSIQNFGEWIGIGSTLKNFLTQNGQDTFFEIFCGT